MPWTLIILLLGAWAAVSGFRRGLARQTPAVIGTAFGIIGTRLLAPGLYHVFDGAFPSIHGRPEEIFVCCTLSTALVFFGIYFIFRAVTFFLSGVLASDNSTILDNLGGALFAMFKYTLFISVALNLLVALHPDSDLLRSARSYDGNTEFEVMLLSPAILGGEDIDDLFHRTQLEEAKKISEAENKTPISVVTNIDTA